MSTVAHRTSAWIGALSLVLLSGTQSAVAAVDQAPKLPPHYRTSPLGFLRSGSADYLLVDNSLRDELGRPAFTPLRVSDGVTLPVVGTPVDSHESWPTIVDESWLQLLDTASDSHVERRDLESGLVTGSIALAYEEVLLHADDQWALVRSAATLSFIPFEGAPVDLTSDDLGEQPWNFTWVAGDSGAAYLASPSRTFWVDPLTGDLTLLTDPSGNRFPATHATAGRVIGARGGIGNDQVVSWLTDPAHNAGYASVVVSSPRQHTFLPLGDGVAAVGDDNTSGDHRLSVQPVDLATGALGEALVENADGVLGLGDGSIAAVVDDLPTGRIVRVDGTGLQSVGPLPLVRQVPNAVFYSSARPLVSWAGPLPGGYPPVTELTAYSGGEWHELAYPSVDTSVSAWVAGGAVLTLEARSYPESTYRISRPDGSFHDLSARTSSAPALSFNGRWAQVPTGGALRYQVQNARTGDVVATYRGERDDTRDHRVITRNRLWSRLGPAGNAVGRDLTGARPDRRLHVPLTCHGGPGTLVDVRGRWVVTECDYTHLTVHDRTGFYRSRTLAGDSALAAFGDGYLVRGVARDLGTDHTTFRLRINALGADHRARSYGPIAWDYLPSFAVDRQGSGAPVYLDEDGGVRRVDLSWLD
ncbi:exported hypothetical protein [metagenome]|uniref:Uncharacterized protein n=1 Tax=metagenome TaxID=256318 RepID=A0A2P2CBX3_9ZZZZ